MNMLRYVFLLLFISIFQFTSAQDQLFMRDGTIMDVKIQSVSENQISYTLPSDERLQVNYISTDNVKKILFESGIEQSFESSNAKEEVIIPVYEEKQSTNDWIYLRDGNMIACNITSKNEYGYSYIPLKGGKGFAEYIPNSKISKVVYANGETDFLNSSKDKRGGERSPFDFTNLSPHYIQLGVGPSIPFGAFGVGQISGGGGARIGLNLSADATYYLFRGLGFNLMVGYSYNPFDDSQFRGFINTNVLPNSTINNLNIGDWHTGYIMGGLGYYNDFGRFMMDYKAYMGVAFVQYPSGSVSFTQSNNEYSYQYSSNSTSFILGGYTGMRYFITRKWGISGGITALFSRATFQPLQRKEYVNDALVSTSQITAEFGQSFSWLMISAGVTYTLGK